MEKPGKNMKKPRQVLLLVASQHFPFTRRKVVSRHVFGNRAWCSEIAELQVQKSNAVLPQLRPNGMKVIHIPRDHSWALRLSGSLETGTPKVDGLSDFSSLSFSHIFPTKIVIWRCTPCSDTPNQSQTLHGRLDFGLDQFFLDQDSLIKFAPAEDWSPRCLQHPRTFTCQIFIVSVVALAQPGWPSQAMGGPWWPVRS
jgi:hypothetical protein